MAYRRRSTRRRVYRSSGRSRYRSYSARRRRAAPRRGRSRRTRGSSRTLRIVVQTVPAAGVMGDTAVQKSARILRARF